MQKIGLIEVPMLWGPTQSLNREVDRYLEEGYPVRTIDYYWDRPMSQPSFLGTFFRHFVLTGFNEERFMSVVDEYAARLLAKPAIIDQIMAHCEELVSLGYAPVMIGRSIGAVFALKLAQSEQTPLKGVVAISPHLAFPTSLIKYRKLEPPNLEAVRCPVLLIQGSADTVIGEVSLEDSRRSEALRHVHYFEAKGGHAFTEANVQGRVPYKFYHEAEARVAQDVIQDWLRRLANAG